MKKLRRNRAGGPSGIRAENIKGWLAAAISCQKNCGTCLKHVIFFHIYYTSLLMISMKHTQTFISFDRFSYSYGQSFYGLTIILPRYLNFSTPYNFWDPILKTIPSILPIQYVLWICLFLSVTWWHFSGLGWMVCNHRCGIWILQYSHMG